MAYFQQNQPPQPPQWDGQDAWTDDPAVMQSFDDGMLPLDEEAELEALREERRENRRIGFRVAAGISDFIGVVLGTVAILLLAALLVTLVNWVITDLRDSFHLG